MPFHWPRLVIELLFFIIIEHATIFMDKVEILEKKVDQ